MTSRDTISIRINDETWAMPCEFKCNCPRRAVKPQIRDHTIYCERCQKVICFTAIEKKENTMFEVIRSLIVDSNSDKDVIDLNSKIQELESELSEARDSFQELQRRHNEVADENSRITAENEQCRQFIEQKTKDIELKGDIIAGLESQMSDLKKTFEEEQLRNRDLDAEMDALRTESAVNKQRIEELERNDTENNERIKELIETKNHLSKDLKESKSIDLRDVTEKFLNYMTWMYNASFERNDMEKLREGIRIKTENTIEKLEVDGLSIKLYDNGSTLGQEPLEIHPKDVSNPSLGRLVEKTMLMGCEFKGNAYSPIQGVVSVYRYQPPVEPEPEQQTVVTSEAFETSSSEEDLSEITPLYGEDTQTTLDPGQVVTVEGKAVPNRTYEPETPKEPVTEGELNLEEIKVQETRLAYRETPPEQRE